jgi:hypothetical protein
VARARALMAQHPSLARLPIFINEYSAKETHLIPGWAIGWISSLESAGVAEAGLACWHEPDVQGRRVTECGDGSLDGLLQPGSGLPQSLYWVYRLYAQMPGLRVSTSASDAATTAYATYDERTGQIRVLIGRHAGCTATVRADCRQPSGATPPPEPVTLRIRAPGGWGAAVITTLRIPNVTGPLPAPVSSGGRIIPASALDVAIGGPSGFADGDGYAVTAARR